jgi:hypothetical protein
MRHPPNPGGIPPLTILYQHLNGLISAYQLYDECMKQQEGDSKKRIAFPIQLFAEGSAAIQPGFLQNPDVRRWLNGIEPAWTMLEFDSYNALNEEPSALVSGSRCMRAFSGFRVCWT